MYCTIFILLIAGQRVSESSHRRRLFAALQVASEDLSVPTLVLERTHLTFDVYFSHLIFFIFHSHSPINNFALTMTLLLLLLLLVLLSFKTRL